MRSVPGAWIRHAAGRVIALAAAAFLAAGCAGDRPKPAQLEDLAPKIAGRQVWRAQLDRVSFSLTPAVREGRVFLAGDGGVVRAIDALSGAQAWEVNVGARVTAGVGSDGRRAAVVTRDNELVVVEEGRVRWRR